jgi:hypothetical protein
MRYLAYTDHFRGRCYSNIHLVHYLPLHVCPSPLNPESQVQMKDPSVLLHVAFAWQGETGRHSFVSK